MTAEQLIEGLRERGYSVLRMQSPPQVLIPMVKPTDPLIDWMQEVGIALIPYEPERFSKPEEIAYEARVQRARVEVDEEGLDPDDPRYLALLAERRALSIWKAAA